MRDGPAEVELADVAHIQQGKTLAVKDMHGGDHAVYGANGVIGQYTRGTYEHGVVAVGCRGSCGTVHLAPAGAFLANNVMGVWPKGTDVSLDMLRLLLEAADMGRQGVITGQVQPQITRKTLGRLKLLVPNTAEQRRWVALFRALDTALARGVESANASDALRSAALQALLSDPNGSWDAKTLGDVCETMSGSTPKAGEARYWDNGTIPYLKSAALTDGPVREPTTFVTDEAVKDYRLRVYEPGTVLLAMYGATRGRLGFLEVPAAGNQAIAALVPDQGRVAPRFLFYWLLHRQRRFVDAGFGGAQKNLSQAFIRKQVMTFPPLPEQHRVVAALDSLSTHAASVRHLNASVHDVRATLLSALQVGSELPAAEWRIAEAVA